LGRKPGKKMIHILKIIPDGVFLFPLGFKIKPERGEQGLGHILNKQPNETH